MQLCVHWFLLTVLLIAPLAANAQEHNKLLEIPRGMSTVDLTGDGKADFILKSSDESNYHGFDVISFLWDNDNQSSQIPAFNSGKTGPGQIVIGIKTNKKDNVHGNIETMRAADCMITDYRLLFKKTKVFLIEADRGPGKPEDSWCADDTVKFKLYRMFYNDGSEVAPEYYFNPFNEWTTKKKYTDVTNAFQENASKLVNMAE